MKFRVLSLSRVSVLGLGLLATLPLLAQDDASEPSPPRAKAATRAYNPARRVPIYFGQVGLTPDQREQIYTIRGNYHKQIADLKSQIEALQAQEMTECEAVLTDAQRKLLELRRASRRGTAPTSENSSPAASSSANESPES